MGTNRKLWEKRAEAAEIKLKETLESLEEKVKARTSELEAAYRSLQENERRLAEAQKWPILEAGTGIF